MSAGQSIGLLMPSAFDSGNQNTLKPYAMPMQRWMHNAAGGTSQRLKPSEAIVRSLARSPVDAPADGLTLMSSVPLMVPSGACIVDGWTYRLHEAYYILTTFGFAVTVHHGTGIDNRLFRAILQDA